MYSICLQAAHIFKQVIDALRTKNLLIRFRKETQEPIELQRILIIALFRNVCIFICFNLQRYAANKQSNKTKKK